MTRIKYKVSNWECPDLSKSTHPNAKEFAGLYESGVVNIPNDLFTGEEIAGWIEEGNLIPTEQ